MEAQGTQKSQNNLEKEEQNWKTHIFQFQNLLHNSSNQNSMVQVLRTDIPLFHSKWNTIKTPEIKPQHLRSTDF